MDVSGRVVAVTGAASGIGLVAARELSAAGAHVAVIDLNEANAVQAAKDMPGRAIGLGADVGDSGDVDRAFDVVLAEFGRLDGLVASAGVPMRKYVPAVEVTDEDWDWVLRVNLRGMFLTCRAAARSMRAAGAGSIVAISSISGSAPRMGQSAYGVSKAGVIQLCRVLALELAEAGVRVNAICPGIVNTPLMQRSRVELGDEVVDRKIHGDLATFRAGIPLRRFAEPEDVASAAMFLLSDAARHITGQSLYVDGGESLV